MDSTTALAVMRTGSASAIRTTSSPPSSRSASTSSPPRCSTTTRGGGTSKCGVYLTAGGISVDQELANRLMGMTKFPNIMMYTGPQSQDVLRLGYRGSLTRASETCGSTSAGRARIRRSIGEFDPTKSFNTIFGGGVAPGAPIDTSAQIARDKSILDAALESYTGLGARVGRDDKIRLDQHAEAIRGIEAQLAGMTSKPAALNCTAPTAPGATDLNAFANYPATLNVQSDLMVAAMACDLTRVGVIEWEPGFSKIVHTWLGINKEHHGISHDTSAGAIENLVKDRELLRQGVQQPHRQAQGHPRGRWHDARQHRGRLDARAW